MATMWTPGIEEKILESPQVCRGHYVYSLECLAVDNMWVEPGRSDDHPVDEKNPNETVLESDRAVSLAQNQT
jgi:hypothetical protein